MKKNIALINTISSLLLTLLTMISGFIIPRLILKTFGSEVHGLVASLQQYLNYISLIEGGLGGVVMASLYSPLRDHDLEKISKIATTVRKFYRRIAVFFALYAVILAAVYQFIVPTSLSFRYVFWLAIILSISMFVQYYFAITYKLILNADKKIYFTAGVQSVCIVLNTLLFIICINVFPSIHLIKGIAAGVYILQPILYKYYINKTIKLDTKVSSDLDLIKDRWNGFGINVAAFVHGNTDIALLSVITGLGQVSVYTVYFMIVNAIRSVIISISGGLQPSVGGLVAEGNIENLKKRYNTYEFFMTLVSFVLFTCCCIMIVPFVRIYTLGVDDVSYEEPLFAILLCIAELTYCLRDPSSMLIYSANRFKDISRYAYMEALLNIVLSVILVFKFGIVGVAVGTLVSIMCRHFFQLRYLAAHILRRPMKYYCKLITVFVLGMIITILGSSVYTDKITINYFNWAMWAVVTMIISIIVFGALSFLFYKQELSEIMKMVRSRKSSTEGEV